jgi:hypothetical protein
VAETSQWPEVSMDDAGMVPAGPLDRCIYCRQTIGQPHGAECVTVVKRVRYQVLVDGEAVGTYVRDDPYFWTEADCDFHKNESSWCADNAVDRVKWHDKAKADEILNRLERDECSCSLLAFRFEGVIDPGPRRGK